MKLTLKRLRAIYDCLRALPPFCDWSLPPAAGIKFKVAKTREWRGLYWRAPYTKTHEISISAARHHHLASVFCTMAHEMVHLYQDISRTDRFDVMHNREFYRLASVVSSELGFDPKEF